jgi:hypothetical protein
MIRNLVGFDSAARTNTSSANASSLMSTIDNDANALKVRVPPSFGNVVGMTHIVSKQRTFPTYITPCCHKYLPHVPIKLAMVAESFLNVNC